MTLPLLTSHYLEYMHSILGAGIVTLLQCQVQQCCILIGASNQKLTKHVPAPACDAQ